MKNNFGKKVALFIMVMAMAVSMIPTTSVEASTFMTKAVNVRASKNSCPIIIKTGGKYYEQYHGYEKISLKLSDPDGIKYYRLNGHKVNGKNKKVININDLCSTSKYAKAGRNTIYVYDIKGNEGSWAFNLLDLDDPENPIFRCPPKIKVNEKKSVRVKGTKNTFKKVTLTLKGSWICSYSVNSKESDKTFAPGESVTLKDLKKTTPGCRKGKNKVTVTCYNGMTTSWTFYLK